MIEFSESFSLLSQLFTLLSFSSKALWIFLLSFITCLIIFSVRSFLSLGKFLSEYFLFYLQWWIGLTNASSPGFCLLVYGDAGDFNICFMFIALLSRWLALLIFLMYLWVFSCSQLLHSELYFLSIEVRRLFFFFHDCM